MSGKLQDKGSGELFGKGAKTYISQKAMERLTQVWENPGMEFVKALRHGKDVEPMAFEAYQQVTRNYGVDYYGTLDPLFIVNSEDDGGSPDGLAGKVGNVDGVAEMKCPLSSLVHMTYLKMKDQFDLFKVNSDYYYQVQDLLRVTKAKWGHWISFDERMIEPKLRLKIIEIKRDEKFISNTEIRIMQAARERDNEIKLIMDTLNY